jgi:hypothetical protein
MTDPRNIAHAKKIQHHKQHKGEEIGQSENGQPTPSLPLPAERKPLIGYDSTMRKHAAACESGR